MIDQTGVTTVAEVPTRLNACPTILVRRPFSVVGQAVSPVSAKLIDSCHGLLTIVVALFLTTRVGGLERGDLLIGDGNGRAAMPLFANEIEFRRGRVAI